MKPQLVRFVLVFLLVLPLSAWAKPQYLILSHVVSPDTPKGKMAAMFRSIVERKMGTKYNVVIHPNSELMDDGEAIDAIARGDIHFAMPSVSKLEASTQNLKVYDLPFLFPDMEAVNRFQDGPVGQSLLASMKPRGIVGLGYLHNGLKQFTANKVFKVPSNHGVLDYMVITNDEFWSSLDPEDRRRFEYAIRMAIKYGNAVAIAKSKNDRDDIRRMRGIEFFEPTAQDLKVWQEQMKLVWKEYEPVIGKDVIDAALKAGSST